MARKPPRRPSEIRAAGVVVLGPGRTVLLVHRPRYDDWSFPKGKLEPGEHELSAAVREAEEETGVQVRLGAPLSPQHYQVKGRDKRVYYWIGRPVGEHDVTGFAANDEVDHVAWVPLAEAAELLTYRYDRRTLSEAVDLRKKTRTLIVLRHTKARARADWHGDDRLRPLQGSGRAHAERLTPLLAAYDARDLVTSSSTRCVESLEPYARLTGHPLQEEAVLSEETADADAVGDLMARLLDKLQQRPASAGGLVICSHRPVLPWVLDSVGLAGPELAPGEFVVAHLRRGRVVASERHR